MTKLINRYIAKIFLIKFLQVITCFMLIIFFINFLDAAEKIRDSSGPFQIAIWMAFLRIPNFLNDVTPSLVLISAIITFFSLSSRSEITVIRSSGLFLWQIIFPVAIAAVLLGLFWIAVIDTVSIAMDKKFNALERKYINHEIREVIEVENGIWLKQNNIENPQEYLIIKAGRVYRDSNEFGDLTFWFFNKKNEFYERLDAKKAMLEKDVWILEEVVINSPGVLNKKSEMVEIKTDLEVDFVVKKVVNNFQNVKSFSLFELPQLITELQSSGFNSTKFKVHFHSLLSKPVLFLSMILIACYFGFNHIRNSNSIFLIFCGMISGLILYISSSIMIALGSSGLIPVFSATWMTALICLAVGTLLIYRKENP